MNTAVLLLALAPLIQPSPPDPRLTELVRQLGHRDFKTREAAASELVKVGAGAIPALNMGLKDIDPEIAGRCGRILPKVLSENRNRLLRQLTDNPGNPLPEGLAGLKRFIAITGDNKGSRQLYAAMMTEHHAIIEAMEADPKSAGRLWVQFCQSTNDRWWSEKLSGRDGLNASTPVPLALLFFLRGDKRFTDDPESQISSFDKNRLFEIFDFHGWLKKADVLPEIKKLFLAWMEGERQTGFLWRGFLTIDVQKMKEAVPSLLKIAAEKDRKEASSRAWALCLLVKLSDKQHLKDVESYLTDESVVSQTLGSNGKTLTLQFRDVALGMAIQLHGFEQNAFGHGPPGYSSGITISPVSNYYFQNDKARDAAFAKWKEFISKPENKRQEP
ncbi:hypothetical protein [Zavarzinella formosa]|uniref:hypothetical protein n=1 Tax=Zavarzinella formosa TaxID=360055 RepID=UPI00031806E9|nr:hypothetical protein [Zavarzinella formosa]